MKQSDRYEMSAAHRRALWFVAIFAGILLTFSLAWTAYTLIASFPAALVVTGPAIALTSTMTWATTKMLSGTARAVVISSAGIEVRPLPGVARPLNGARFAESRDSVWIYGKGRFTACASCSKTASQS